jgi:hypothetical protein
MQTRYSESIDCRNLLSARDSADLILELIMRSVLVGDDDLRAVAAELLRRFDDQGVRRFIRIAENQDNSSQHRVRALLAIWRFGAIPDRSSFLDLQFLARDTDERVAAVAADLIATLPQRLSPNLRRTGT